jgi:predicted Zn-dependent protease
MDALSRDQALAGSDPNRRSFLDTHPTTPARSQRTLERAATLHIARLAPIAPDVRNFYEKLDGLLYGVPASHGVVVDDEFLHPCLDVRVAFPSGWQIENARDSVVAAPESGDALAVFSIAAEGDDPIAVANQVIRRSSLRVDGRVETTQIGGRPAARVAARHRAGWFTHCRDLIVWVGHGGYVYQVAATTLERDWPHYRDTLAGVTESFRPLARGDHQRVREARIRVVAAQPGEDLPALLERVDSAWSPERAAAFNGFASEHAELGAGQPVKVARWEVYRKESCPSSS